VKGVPGVKKRRSLKQDKKRVLEIIRLLKETYPEAQCTLNHRNPLQLLVSAILSAQCTDERVNQVTPALFQKYPTAVDFAQAPRKELEQAIKSTGFYKNKARHIQNACRTILQKFDGEVPRRMEDLLTLDGVGRKTANVVLGNAYHIASGVVVDTHVQRLSRRLNFSRQKTPEGVERDLIRLIPKSEWILFSHLLIAHGRKICKARKPLCGVCVLQHLCPSAFAFG